MAHTFTNLLTHLIFSTKDRKPLLDAVSPLPGLAILRRQPTARALGYRLSLLRSFLAEVIRAYNRYNPFRQIKIDRWTCA